MQSDNNSHSTLMTDYNNPQNVHLTDGRLLFGVIKNNV